MVAIHAVTTTGATAALCHSVGLARATLYRRRPPVRLATPAVRANSVSSIASAVEFAPVPAITGMRPAACSTVTRISSQCSSTLTVGDSPGNRSPWNGRMSF